MWIRVLIGAACLLIIGLLFAELYKSDWAKETRARNAAAQAAEQEARTQLYLNNIVKSIRYFKDPRTNTCFAMVSTSGHNRYGIGISKVTCDDIPSNILKVAEPN